MAYQRLGSILVNAGTITEDQVQEALLYGKENKQRLGEALVNLGYITEDQVIEVLQIQLGVDYVDPTTLTLSPALVKIVPKNLAYKYNILPTEVNGDDLYVAMADPLNFKAIEELRNITRKHIVPLIAKAELVNKAITTLYGEESVTKAISDLQQTIGDDFDLAGIDNLGAVNDIDSNANNAPSVRLVNSIIERAVLSNASDIHLEPQADELVVRNRIDGVLHRTISVPRVLQNSVIARIKIMGDMDISEKRIPQDGRTTITAHGRDFDLRISSLPTKYGEKIVIRFLEKSQSLLNTKTIGLEGEHLKQFEDLLGNTNGVILISGPTGSGKSTTMYTMIAKLNTEDVNLVTLEDPIEYDLPGINQVQINEKTGMTFASGLRSILRQDPDIIAVGEIRDGETAEIAMRSAITGHLVLSTIHTNSAVSSIDRLVDIGVEPYLITSALKGVIAQRLVRRLCPNCKKEYTPSAEELQSLGLPEDSDVKFYKACGCEKCMETGYKGRIAVFEILVLDNDIKRAFRADPRGNGLYDAVAKSGFKPMIDNCRDLVLRGVTTVEESNRILHTTD